MHKKLLGSPFPHTLQLGHDLGKPTVFLAIEETGAATRDPARVGITACSLAVIGPYEHPYMVDALINPECRIDAGMEAVNGISQRQVSQEKTLPEFWAGGHGNAVSGGLVAGYPELAHTLEQIDAQLRRYELPLPTWDRLDLVAFYSEASGTPWTGTLTELGERLGVTIPTSARRTTAEVLLCARVFEALLAQFGTGSLGGARRTARRTPAPAPALAEDSDPFAVLQPPRTRPGLRLVNPATGGDPDPFDVGGLDGDSVPPMTPFYGGALTMQECCDAMLEKLIADGAVKNYADVIGALRGMGLIIEKSLNPYEGVVVETAIRAKRRLRGRYYRPNFVLPSAGEEMQATLASVTAQKHDLMGRLEAQIREHGYQSLEHQLRQVEADFPQATRPSIAYAVSMLLDQGRLEHETTADESVLSWLTEAVRPFVKETVLLKPIMANLMVSPALTKAQIDRLDYVQLRVALHRLGVVYPAKRRDD